MKAIIFSAGRPAVGTEPVANLEIGGQRLLDLQVACLRTCGIEDIAVVTGYGAAAVKRPDVTIREAQRWDQEGSIGSLMQVSSELNGDDDIVLLYGDTVFSLEVVQDLLDAEGGVCALCYLDRQNRDLEGFREYAAVEGDAVRRVTGGPESRGVRTVFTGMVLFRRSKVRLVRTFLDELQLARGQHLGALLNEMCERGVHVSPVLVDRGWAEITSETLYGDFLADTDLVREVIKVHTDWSERAKRYDRLDWVNNDSLLSAIVNVGSEVEPERAMDVGTGTGKVLFALGEALNVKELWGVDSSEAMLNKMPKKDGLIVRCIDIEIGNPELPVEFFDLITARMVFHHLTRSSTALNNIRRTLRPGGMIVVCEGVPPTSRSVQWYTEMFSYKEDRRTLTEGDLAAMLVKSGFEDVVTRSVVMDNCSLNNWLDNSGLPEENIRIIKEMHFNAPEHIREDYDMVFEDGDCLMRWRFAVTSARVPGVAVV